uniref:Glycosyltransferases n=1 Tax=Cicer arietinum TaxID=3827 RepID=A0A3Q7YFA9_CICAR|nr:probable beta-1,4-xylosyltransferase IRX9H isoform X2 [Cicer arietinum]
MASIRRTMTQVPVELCSVASSLSKSSHSPRNSPPSDRLLSSSVTALDSRASVLGVFSPRSLRAIERSKPKGQIWRKVIFHFFICFIIGVSIGLIPLASRNLLSPNLMSKHQDFDIEVISKVRNFRSLDENAKINETPLVVDEDVKFDATLISAVQEQQLTDGVAYKISNSQFYEDSYFESRKLLIIVTPTYNRLFQAYYLHRLSQTLKLAAPPLLWIVVETNSQSEETADILRSSGIMYRHLICKMNLTNNTSHRRNLMRNAAIAHIETHRLDGIVYFADDDNVYSVELFQQMREIRRFGTWTVARPSGDKSGIILQGPICNGSQVIGWHINNESDVKPKRFHAEMPGFAFNSTILWDPKKWHRPALKPIMQLESVKENLWVG